MRKNITFFGCLVVVYGYIGSVYAWLPEYNMNTARDYLLSKDHIVIAMKIRGDINYREYQYLVNSYNESVDEKGLYRDWKSRVEEKLNKYIIIKNIKGNLGASINIPAGTPGVYSTNLGELALMFLDKKSGKIEMGYCDVFFASDIPDPILRSDTEKELIDYIVENKLSPCLKEKSKGHP